MVDSVVLARRLVVSCAAMGALCCGQLLEIPSDPRLQAEPFSTDAAVSAAGGDSAPQESVVIGANEQYDASLTSTAGGEATRPPELQTQAEQSTGSQGAAANDAGLFPVRPEEDARLPMLDASTSAISPDAQVARPCGALEQLGPNQRCHFYNPDPLSWQAARQECLARSDGWDLAEVLNSVDNDFASSMVSPEAWVGASDSATEEDWRWVASDTPFWLGDGDTGSAVQGRFSLFSSGEPNGETGSNCLRLRQSGTWGDLECEDPLPSLCMGPPRQ